MDDLGAIFHSDYTGPSILALVALFVITRRLTWYTDARKVERQLSEDRDYWRDMALNLLGVTEKLTVQSEVTNDLLSRLPDPAEAGEPS